MASRAAEVHVNEGEARQLAELGEPARHAWPPAVSGEEDATLAQRLGQLQPLIAVCPAFFGTALREERGSLYSERDRPAGRARLNMCYSPRHACVLSPRVN